MSVDVELMHKLDNMDNEYGGENMYKILGPTGLSWTSVDSSRMYMFTSHIKQCLTLLNPQVPRISTGMENAIGKTNLAYCKLEGTWEVMAIIEKFSFPEEKKNDPEFRKNQIYMMVFYNKKEDKYEMIEKKISENKSERFGFVYDNSFIDSLKVGDKVTDPILYKSTSYDEHMNYRYGINARVYYATCTDTIEDALVIRKGWADTVKTVEIDKIYIPINDNDVLLNTQGTDDQYKGFPNIGEEVNDSLVCATRRINKNHLLYDFQKNHTRELLDTDDDYYTSKHAVITDCQVYYNGEDEFPNNLFYHQMKQYYDDGNRYADAVTHWCNKIKKSGSKYSKKVTYYKSKYERWTDPEYKWVHKEKPFSHILLEFSTCAENGLDFGGKLSGRLKRSIYNNPDQIIIYYFLNALKTP